MINVIKKIYYCLDLKYKKKLFLIQILLLFAAILELITVFSIAPLIQLISNLEILNDSSQFITKVYIFFKIESHSEFLKIISICIFFIFFINFILALSASYIIEKFAQEFGNFLKLKIFKILSLQSWLDHSRRDLSTYVNLIIHETSRVSQNAVLPLMNLNAKLFSGIAIIIFIFIYNPKITIICFLIFFIFYLIIFKLVKKIIDNNGLIQSLTSQSMYKKIFETFGGIKDTILHNKQKKFHDQLNVEAKKYARATINIAFFRNSPKLFLEFIAFSIIILSIILTVSDNDESNFKNALPLLAVYTFAGYKLLPVFQTIYYGLLSVRSSISAVDLIYKEVEGKKDLKFKIDDSLEKNNFILNDKIELKNISFNYLNSSKPAVTKVNLTIPANSIISIVGSSGSGKSTILDIILGLIKPQTGEVFIDDKPINLILENFQKKISYVAQNIFLQNESIKSNICFGLETNEIDLKKLDHAVNASNLTDLIKELPDGLETIIGERGKKISGGQQQRIAIARALYLDRDIIILDEATSSLDGISEGYIFDKLKLFAKKYNKTIIIVTHNINLTRISDLIYLIDKGSINDKGSFNDLLKNNIFLKLLNEKK